MTDHPPPKSEHHPINRVNLRDISVGQICAASQGLISGACPFKTAHCPFMHSNAETHSTPNRNAQKGRFEKGRTSTNTTPKSSQDTASSTTAPANSAILSEAGRAFQPEKRLAHHVLHPVLCHFSVQKVTFLVLGFGAVPSSRPHPPAGARQCGI